MKIRLVRMAVFHAADGRTDMRKLMSFVIIVFF